MLILVTGEARAPGWCSFTLYDLLGQQIKCGQGTTTSHSVLCSAVKKKSLYREQLSLFPLPQLFYPPSRIKGQSWFRRKADKDPQPRTSFQPRDKDCSSVATGLIASKVVPQYVINHCGSSGQSPVFCGREAGPILAPIPSWSSWHAVEMLALRDKRPPALASGEHPGSCSSVRRCVVA